MVVEIMPRRFFDGSNNAKIADWLVQTTEENPEILHRRGFQVNMRLYNNNKDYRNVILHIIHYMEEVSNKKYSNFLVWGMSGANVGIPFNIICIRRNNEKIETLINPQIISYSIDAREVHVQGCGSIPNCGQVTLSRPARVTVSYYTVDGRNKVEEFSHFNSFVTQHEIDHNNGILITDYGKIRKKRMLKLTKRL